ncbi:MAG: major capsid protein [Microvirus sp.]|nr:MAG: major capsid protein [Microvirus sp.]
MKRQIQTGNTFPERMEKHADKTWHDLSFNHKTTLTMGELIPLATKEVYPGELVRLQNEVKLKFAQLYLPIMHQCYFTVDWYYIRNGSIWPNYQQGDYYSGWEAFIKEDPLNASITWPWFNYKRADAVYTNGILNYMGFNAPPGGGTLISQYKVSALPPYAYAKVWDEYYRNDQIQTSIWYNLLSGDNTSNIETMLPDLRVLRRNWPRDYYTSATPTPQTGANILIPSYATDPETGDFVAQKVFKLDGTDAPAANLSAGIYGSDSYLQVSGTGQMVLQLSSTIRDFRYAAQMTEFLERSLRAGDRYVDFVQRNFKWNPNPLFIDRPVWIGGYTGDVMISEVLATAEAGAYTVGQYTGHAIARDNTPVFQYQVPDYGFIMCLMTVYPKASYYSGLENMWKRETKMDYMWEQFALIGDQPLRNREVWFSWYDADIAWNDEIFGYLPQYTQFKYSNDIVSGQMRTLWEGFHLGRKFTGAGEVVLNSDFITCVPDIGRVFNVDVESGEHECLVHAYNKIEILRRLPANALPQL